MGLISAEGGDIMARMRRMQNVMACAALAMLTMGCATEKPGTVFCAGVKQKLCYADAIVPGLRTDLRYAGYDNFVGRPLAGYEGHRAILRLDAARALAKAARELAKEGLGLLVYDAYRPARAMRDFYEWSKTPDARMRSKYYPNITKKGIYEGKYIRDISEHSWCIAVDITLCDLKTGFPLDMGGHHDLLDESSATDYPGISPTQQANRRKLRAALHRVGFVNYSKEWWHYYFESDAPLYSYDFPIRDSRDES